MNEGFSLLVVGMLTVFSILFLVVTSAKLLINLVNRLSPTPVQTKLSKEVKKPSDIQPKVLSAILAAVDIATKSQARVKEIKRQTD